MRVRPTHAAVVLALSAAVFAQSPPPPERGNASVTVGGRMVAVDYGRPALKQRKIEELMKDLPADRIWRMGVNQVTTLTTKTDLLIAGKKVPAGKYSVYAHLPTSGDWSFILNTDPGIELVKIFPQAPPSVATALWPRLDGYDKVLDKEVVRAPMKKGTASPPVDLFTMDLASAKDGATLTLSWGDESWSLDLRAAK